MRLKTNVGMTDDRFAVFKESVQNALEADRAQRRSGAALPRVLGVKLTNRCNLRCAHCYQWNEDGYHHAMPVLERKADLDLGLFRRLMEETREHRSRTYLWGGEPLVHRQIGEILEELRKDEREITICTNGHLIDRHYPALVELGGRLELLLALEGFEEQHDAIRGKGSFARVMGAIERMIADRKAGKFDVKISIHVVINNENLLTLHSFIRHLADVGVDLVLITFPWYISGETSQAMDGYVAEKFDWLIDTGRTHHTWDAFKYRVEPASVPALLEQLRLINADAWPMNVRYQPELEEDEIEAFISGAEMVVQAASHCSVLDTRIDIGPTGHATACKFFSEFAVGDLKDRSLAEVWNGEAYRRIREELRNGLTPACSKCNVLHLQKNSIPLHF